MRCFCKITILLFILSSTIARPSNIQDRNEYEAEEAEYHNSDEAEDSVQEDDDSRFNDEDSSVDSNESARQPAANREREFNMQQAVADPADRSDNENVMEYSQKSKEEKLEDDASLSNNAIPLSKQRQSDRYHNGNSDFNKQQFNDNYGPNHIKNDDHNNELDKRTVNNPDLASFEDDLLMDGKKEHENNPVKVEYRNDVHNPSEQTRHFKQYYNTMLAERPNVKGDQSYEMSNRDRRQAEKIDSVTFPTSSTEKEQFNSINVKEDDEAAIKRHIKKLSGEELEELLNSLSDDKKALLNQIIENNHDLESLNKREITKKSDAVGENNYIDNSMSELSKNQGISSSVEFNTESFVTQSSDAENTKQESQTESSDITIAKSSEGTQGDNPDMKIKKSDESSDNIKIGINSSSNDDAKVAAKIENKREASPEYLNNENESFEGTQFSDNNLNNLDDTFDDQNDLHLSEDLSQLTNDETLHNEYKREVNHDGDIDINDSLRSLEESFPNSYSEDTEQNSASNLKPLVRVKRKNRNAIKDIAGIFSNSKVAYEPYKAENDDEDNDEGSEFDDDGFYDRTSNYAKSGASKPDDQVGCQNYILQSQEEKPKETNNNLDKILEPSANEKLERDTTSLGSDTDSVLSGIEGVNDNLMYSSGSRIKRNPDNKVMPQLDAERVQRSTPISNDAIEPSNSLLNGLNFQENDAFGALPRNYENELGRYKRVRHVKEDTASNT